MHRLIGELDRAGGFKPQTVLVIDEAGMAPTRVSAALLAHAERAGVKVIAVGDPGQLASVQAGGWLAALARRQPGPQLREVIRQRDPSERRALQALHDGHPDTYIAHKRDAINIHPTEHQAVDAIADQWHAGRQEHGPTNAVMIARDNHTRELLNQAARERLKRARLLPVQGVVIGRREYAPGDRVIARRNDRARDIDNGTLGTVIDIDSRNRNMLLQTDGGQRRELDIVYTAQHIEHAYALTGHGAQGATVTWAGVIGRPEEFTREWAYTALSRAREQTVLHVIGEQPRGELERRQYAPHQPNRDPAETLDALRRAMNHGDAEPLAAEHAAHRELVQALTGHAMSPNSAVRQDQLLQPTPPGFSPPTLSRAHDRSPPQLGARRSL
jgi:ATP-dependent exoDNAse (exonuclease V) alpha subunit